MRNAHSRYGAWYNRKHGREGKVAYDRPKTLEIEDHESHMRVMFYGDCNPVRVGLVKHPTEYRHSSCRFYAFGEKSKQTEQLDPPAWYIALGRTPRERQRRYRQLLDAYLRSIDLLEDRESYCQGRFIGQLLWCEQRKRDLREAAKARAGPS